VAGLSAAPEAREQLAADDASAFVRFCVEIVLLIVLAICIWLNVRIIRRYRKSA